MVWYTEYQIIVFVRQAAIAMAFLHDKGVRWYVLVFMHDKGWENWSLCHFCNRNGFIHRISNDCFCKPDRHCHGSQGSKVELRRCVLHVFRTRSRIVNSNCIFTFKEMVCALMVFHHNKQTNRTDSDFAIVFQYKKSRRVTTHHCIFHCILIWFVLLG